MTTASSDLPPSTAGSVPPDPGNAPWQAPPPWAVADQRSNPAARWALGLGIASVVPGVAPGAVAAGVLGLLRSRRTDGHGLVAALVGLVLGVVLLLADVGLGAAVATGLLPLHHGAPATASDGDSGAQGLPDPTDRTDAALSTTEQSYVDHLADVTYLNFDDDTLIAMGHLVCRDLDAGRTPAEDSDRLFDRYGAGTGDAWDAQKAATTDFCPQHADLLRPPAAPET